MPYVAKKTIAWKILDANPNATFEEALEQGFTSDSGYWDWCRREWRLRRNRVGQAAREKVDTQTAVTQEVGSSEDQGGTTDQDGENKTEQDENEEAMGGTTGRENTPGASPPRLGMADMPPAPPDGPPTDQGAPPPDEPEERPRPARKASSEPLGVNASEKAGTQTPTKPLGASEEEVLVRLNAVRITPSNLALYEAIREHFGIEDTLEEWINLSVRRCWSLLNVRLALVVPGTLAQEGTSDAQNGNGRSHGVTPGGATIYQH